MTTTTTHTEIPHAARCRRPAPVLRLSWRGTPELWCGGCGRSTAMPVPPVVDDTTTTTDKETTT